MKNRMFLIIAVVFTIIVCVESVMLIVFSSTIKKHNQSIMELFKYSDVIKTSEAPLTYITKKESALDDFKKHLQKNGWSFLEEKQLGAAYCFEKENKEIYYSITYEELYAVWTLQS